MCWELEKTENDEMKIQAFDVSLLWIFFKQETCLSIQRLGTGKYDPWIYPSIEVFGLYRNTFDNYSSWKCRNWL